MQISGLLAGIRNIGLIGMFSSIAYFLYSLLYLNYISTFATTQAQFIVAAASLFASVSSVYTFMIGMAVQAVAAEVLKIIADVKVSQE